MSVSEAQPPTRLTLRKLLVCVHKELAKAEGAYARMLEREATAMALEDSERGPIPIGDDGTGRNVWAEDLDEPDRSFFRAPLTEAQIAEARAKMVEQEELVRKIAAGETTLLRVKKLFEIDDQQVYALQYIPVWKHYAFEAASRLRETPEAKRRGKYRELWAWVADRIIDRVTVPGITRDNLRVWISMDCMRSGRSSPLTTDLERLHREGMTAEIVAEIGERFPDQAGELGLRVAQEDLPGLGRNAQLVYEFLLSRPGYELVRIGEILDHLCSEHRVILDEDTLRKRVLPELEPYGLENQKRRGYRILPSRRPS